MRPAEAMLSYICSQPVIQIYPSLTKEWSGKNFYGPELYGPSSSKRVTLTCEHGHTYVGTVVERTRALTNKTQKNGCPICAGHIPMYKDSLAARHPAVASEWHDFRNGSRRPAEIHYNSNQYAYWRCGNCAHSYKERVCARTATINPRGCPNCGHVVRLKSASRKCFRIGQTKGGGTTTASAI
jgi:Probable Zinc-ribbon domain